jgi:hypothetical protein
MVAAMREGKRKATVGERVRQCPMRHACCYPISAECGEENADERRGLGGKTEGLWISRACVAKVVSSRVSSGKKQAAEQWACSRMRNPSKAAGEQ